MSEFMQPTGSNVMGGKEQRDREQREREQRDRATLRENLKMRQRDNMWYFTAEELANSPSRANGIGADQELVYRQMTAYLIQDMGQRLQVYVLIYYDMNNMNE